jgi:hypothetical protein
VIPVPGLNKIKASEADADAVYMRVNEEAPTMDNAKISLNLEAV